MFLQYFVVSILPFPLDIPDDPCQDPNDDADFELPDQQELMDAFMAGLAKESDPDFRRLLQLLSKLPDLSQSHGDVVTI
jgi:hypothetical protein